jgi:hypothetical protein
MDLNFKDESASNSIYSSNSIKISKILSKHVSRHSSSDRSVEDGRDTLLPEPVRRAHHDDVVLRV